MSEHEVGDKVGRSKGSSIGDGTKTEAEVEKSPSDAAAADQSSRESSAREGSVKGSSREIDKKSVNSDRDKGGDEGSSGSTQYVKAGDGGREGYGGKGVEEAAVDREKRQSGEGAGDRNSMSSGESGSGEKASTGGGVDACNKESEESGGSKGGGPTGGTSAVHEKRDESGAKNGAPGNNGITESSEPEPKPAPEGHESGARKEGDGDSAGGADSGHADKNGGDENRKENDDTGEITTSAQGGGGGSGKDNDSHEENKAAGTGEGLTIDITNVNNSGVTGVAGTDKRVPSDAGSGQSSSFEEEPDELEVDLDKPWEKPSKGNAKKAGKRMIWNNGMRHYFSTSIKEIGAMGVGMYLYFWVVRVMAIMFFFCTFLSIPAMVLNQQGNGGMAISETDMDSLGLVSISFGNQGLNPDLVVESGCTSSNGTVDCTGETVQVFGQAEDVLWVGYVLVGGEIVISLFFVLFIVILSERLKAKIDEIDDANVTPGDYTVMVRGLPADVTKEEVRKHFSDLYSLVTPGPSYPFLGVSSTGVGIFWGCTLGLIIGLLAAPWAVEYADMGTGAPGFGIGACTVLLCMMAVYTVVDCFGIGGPRKRDTPEEEWEKGRKKRAKDAKTSAASKYSAAPGKVLPVETAPDTTDVPGDGAGNVNKEFDNTGVLGAIDGGAGEVNTLEEGGGNGVAAAAGGGGEGGGEGGGAESRVSPALEAKIAEEEPHQSSDFTDGRPPDPLPCHSCLNSHDKSFIGGWVADAVLGNPVGDVLMGFMDQKAAIAKISKARTVVRQMKTLKKAKNLVKAEKKLAKLKAKEEALMAATRKKQDPAALEKISVAFVTFEHKESKRRCLEDFRYSRRGFCRRFQPTKLQLSRMPAEEQQGDQAPSTRRGRKKRPRVSRWRLKVFQAPEPSDVKWENLDVTPMSRKLRRAFTSLVCLVLLILSFVIIYLAQTEQQKLQEQIPSMDTCEEAIPAVTFGTYDFPLEAALQRNDSMDSTCADGSFYLAFSANATDPNSKELDYNDLPPIFSADGTNVSRAAFEEAADAELCDDPCQPASGGTTCRALSCYEESWEADYGCVNYPQSTMIGCFCLDAVVTSFRENGLVDGAKVVSREQGEVCAPFLRDYAKANAIKILAVMSVVIVNTLLTSVMEKLAKFERHVSLSDYTSTVTAKLALAQFLNTALIVIIVNAGYSGGGLDILKDMGILAGEYNDFERSWYATVGLAVAMTMLINVIVPHATTLVGEIIVKPIKRLIKRRSVATQTQMNNLYKPPKFSMESRYAFLLQVLGVALLYSGGIPVLYLFASFSFFTNFIVDKFWIIKLAQQPPMFTAALAKMFVGVLPLALLMHMCTTCYMLGNVDILNIGFVSDEAQTIAEALDGRGLSGLVADHVLRKHVFPLFVLTAVFVALYVAYTVVGDPLLQLIKLILRLAFNFFFSWMCKKKAKKLTDEQQQQPGYTAEFFRVLKKGEKLDTDEKKMGWVESVQSGKRIAKWICLEDGHGPRGVKYKAGVPRQTWQVIAELGQYNYAMEESDHAGMATRYMATAGFLSPRMKERELAKTNKIERLVVAEEGGARIPGAPDEAEVEAARSTAADATTGELQQDAPAAPSSVNNTPDDKPVALPVGEEGEKLAPVAGGDATATSRPIDDDASAPPAAAAAEGGEAVDPGPALDDETNGDQSVSGESKGQQDAVPPPGGKRNDAAATSARSDRSSDGESTRSKEAGSTSADGAKEEKSTAGSEILDDKASSVNGAADAGAGGGSGAGDEESESAAVDGAEAR